MSTPPNESTGMSYLCNSGVPGSQDVPHAPQSPPRRHCEAPAARTTPPNEVIETYVQVAAVDMPPPITHSASGVPLPPDSEQQRQQQHNRLWRLRIGYAEQRHEREQREQDVADRTHPDKKVRQEGDDENRVPLVAAVSECAPPPRGRTILHDRTLTRSRPAGCTGRHWRFRCRGGCRRRPCCFTRYPCRCASACSGSCWPSR